VAVNGPGPAGIRTRLVLAVFSAALLAAVTAAAGLLLFERLTLESRARAIVGPYAQIVSVGAEAAVAFGDAPRAQEILGSLRAHAQILAAQIVLADGRVLARHGDAAAWPLARERADGVQLAPTRNAAELVHGLNDGARLHLVLDLGGLQHEARRTLLVFAAGVVAVLGVVMVGLLVALQRGIVRPIAALAGAVDEVRDGANYARRVPAEGVDELARLGVGINALLTVVQQRDEQLQRLNALQRTILDNVGSAIFSVTPDGIVTSFNPAAERLLGYSAAQVLGRLTPLAWHDATELERRAVALSAELGTPVAPGFEVFAARPRRGLPEASDWTFVRRDGVRVPVHLTVTMLRDESDHITGFVGLAADLTERMQAEEALRRQQEKLEQTVRQRTAELQLARDAAEAANRAKSAFLANMSHEIRTPMNAILGMSDLALLCGLPAQPQDYVRKARDAAESLLGIINDILDFSKIEAGRLDLECIAFTLDAVLDKLVGMLGMKAEEAGLELLLALPPRLPGPLRGDPSRIGQVLLNLAGNAVKFTERGEVVIAIEVRDATARSARLAFEVSDSGVGMSAELRGRLFEPFAQGDASTSRRYGGTGLGLAISRHLVQLMGGELQVDSAPGRGSRFRFELRFEREPGGDAWPAPRDDTLSGLRMLVAHHNARARALLSGMAQDLGLRVEAVSDGEQALHRLAEADAAGQPCALLLLDATLPGLDAVACLRALAQAPLRQRVPVLLAAAPLARAALPQRLAEAGVPQVVLLDKPVTSAALSEACRTALGCAPPQPAKPAVAPAALPAGLRGARVLLVEDNAINSEIALALLQRAGLQVDVAGDGHEALALLERERFDLVLMDCQMPVMDGYAATRALRERPELRTLPVIAMTANAMVGDRDAALAAGMNDHIAKPIRIDEMFATLARWLAPERPHR
jgi:PAS domain S-box-containing protein